MEFPRPTYKTAKKAPLQVTPHVEVQSGTEGKTSEKVSEKTSEKILRLARTNQQITIAELADTIGITTRSIERNIKKLQTEGRLKRIGPDKGGSWYVD